MGNDLETKLKEIVSKVFLVNETRISDQMSRKDVKSWDSMAHLVLVTEVESAFGVMMNDDDIIGIKTYGDLKRVLRNLGVDL